MFDSRAVKPAHVIRVDIDDNDALYAAYMPFIKNGGIFVRREQLADINCSLGDNIHLLLHLKEENDRLPVHGRTVWVTGRSNSRHPAGIGVQFSDRGETQRHLGNLLLDKHSSDEPTLTL